MKKILILSALIVGLASTAYSHGKAAGIVRERMDSMIVLAKTIKELSTMTKSSLPIDPEKMSQAAEAVTAHSGTNFTSLFPEGSTQHSEATDAVWTERAEFQRIADELSRLGKELSDVTNNSELVLKISAISKTCTSCHETYRQKTE
jgi:cytochrome c556